MLGLFLEGYLSRSFQISSEMMACLSDPFLQITISILLGLGNISTTTWPFVIFKILSQLMEGEGALAQDFPLALGVTVGLEVVPGLV